MAAGWLDRILGVSGGVAEVVKSVGDTAKQFITTDADRNAFELEMQKAALEIQKLHLSAESARLSDVSSAREMYKSDSLIQKILAVLFTASFFGFMVFLLFMLRDAALPEAQENLVFTMFGAISGIMVTIIGFYFGSSQSSKDKDSRLGSIAERAASKE